MKTVNTTRFEFQYPMLRNVKSDIDNSLSSLKIGRQMELNVLNIAKGGNLPIRTIDTTKKCVIKKTISGNETKEDINKKCLLKLNQHFHVAKHDQINYHLIYHAVAI